MLFNPECSYYIFNSQRFTSHLVDGAEKVYIVVLPGEDVDLKLDFDLSAECQRQEVYGVYICGGSQKVNINVRLSHSTPRCYSNQNFKGIVNAQARVSFDGLILVKPGADGTEAYQQNHNLLLSSDAKVLSQPQLEIYADDVKCSHGATSGWLDPEARFYMQSRGIPEQEALYLQKLSFIHEVIADLPDELQDEILSYL